MKRTRTTAGFVTAEFVFGLVMAYAVLFFAFNFIAYQYGRGVVRAALDEGTRRGSRADAPADACLTRIHRVLDESMGAEFRKQVPDGELSCVVAGTRVTASAGFHFHSLLLSVGDLNTTIHASSHKEVHP